MLFLRALILLPFLFFSLSAHSLNIDTNHYTIYFDDVNEDGFEDVYFRAKERFVPIAGETLFR